MSTNRIELTSVASDYNLEVDQTAVIKFTNAINVPLHIATESGTGYEMKLFNEGPAGKSDDNMPVPIRFLPNNNKTESKEELFSFIEMVHTSQSNVFGSKVRYRSFRIGYGTCMLSCVISNFTTFKVIQSQVSETDDVGMWAITSSCTCVWEDTTTPWTSLGTIELPYPQTGSIVIKRVL